MKRLSGKKNGFFSKCTLWLDEEHLLAVEWHYFIETYKHFDLKDIQAITIRRTPANVTCNVILSIMVCIFGLMLWAGMAKDSMALSTFSSIILAGLVLCLAVNLIRGPTCVCHLKMPFAVHQLPSLCRLKYARKALDRLRAVVLSVQGEITPEEVRPAGNPGEETTHGTAPLLNQPAESAWLPHLQEYNDPAHMILFGVLLLDAALNLVFYYYHNVSLFVVGSLVSSAVLILIIIALIKQSGRSLPATVKGLVWLVLVVFIFANMFVYGYKFINIVQKGQLEQMQTSYDQVIALSRIKPADHPILAKAAVFNIIAAAACGIWGIVAMVIGRRWRASKIPSARHRTIVLREGGRA
ncbi:MAG: hypothetical protein AB9866_05695 [Syntrophobacteraceae bacterium]